MERKNLKNFDQIKVRLLQFAESQKIPKVKFFEQNQLAASNFSGKGAESALSTDKIVQILTCYPDLNSDWLLLGRGEMLRKNNAKNVNIASGPQSLAGDGTLTVEAPSQLLSIIVSQQETINRLSQTIDRLTTN